jgi:hypothetical protein
MSGEVQEDELPGSLPWFCSRPVLAPRRRASFALVRLGGSNGDAFVPTGAKVTHARCPRNPSLVGVQYYGNGE